MDLAALQRLQEECLADDVELHEPTMRHWTEDEVRAYFESGGRVMPTPPSSAHELRLGGVSLRVAPSPRVPEAVPWRGGVEAAAASQGSLHLLRWLMTQIAIGQHALILADPGAHARRVVEWMCALLGREMEYVGITRDTTESDLKQRREIRRGTIEYEAAPPLRAALHGRVLLLEGVEKAERNVLPLLNNLLENREMALEDGTFLSAPHVASSTRSCHPDFVVIAIGLPHPAYVGNPLDPPLRSRFACRRLRADAGDDAMATVRAQVPRLSHNVAAGLVAAVDAFRLRAAVGERAADGARLSGRHRLPFFPERGLLAAASLLDAFPRISHVSVIHRQLPFTQLMLSETAQETLRAELARLLPLPVPSAVWYGLSNAEPVPLRPDRCVLTFSAAGSPRDSLPPHVSLEAFCGGAGPWQPDASPPLRPPSRGEETVDTMSVAQLKEKLDELGVERRGMVEKGEMRRAVRAALAKAGMEEVDEAWRTWCDAEPPLLDSQLRVLGEMLQDHALGYDCCLLAPRGAGKSTLVRRFALLLGYDVYTTFCHQEMSSHELLQRRTTDAEGNTLWQDSPLLLAAQSGGLGVIDGAHRLPPGSLTGAAGPLLSERQILSLPDGRRMLSPQHWDHLLSSGLTSAALASKGLLRAHPRFRVVLCAEPPTAASAWAHDEVLSLASCHTLAELSLAEQRRLLRLHALTPRALPPLLALLRWDAAVRRAAAAEPALAAARLSWRQLLRAARFLAARPDDAAGAVGRGSAAALLGMPPAARETARALLEAAVAAEGMEAAASLRAVDETLGRRAARGGGAGGAAAAAAAAREAKQLEEQAIHLRTSEMFGAADAALAGAVARGAAAAAARREEARRRAMEQVTEGARAAAAGAAGGERTEADLAIQVKDGMLTIGDVSAPVREASSAELVPNPAFVPIRGHVLLLRELLIDWELGQHLLLLGVQGVGKNKLADKLLSLLNAEREYVQLHRDTTVASLTLRPVLRNGAILWEDSALVRAARLGRVLVVDEADKAPLEVVCVLKALAEDGELTLGDGRRLQAETAHRTSKKASTHHGEVLPVAAGFRMIVLANPPGWPFQGNDFFRECGDVFSAHAVPNPDVESQAQLLHRIAPGLSAPDVVTLLSLFGQLRLLHAQGSIHYPYSMRELAIVARHLNAFPADGLQGALLDVFDFDAEDATTAALVADLLSAHGLAALATAVRTGRSFGNMKLQLNQTRSEVGRALGEEHSPPPIDQAGPKHGEWDGKQHIGGNRFAGGSGGTGTAGLGGRAGPYRLDVGQDVHMLREDEKRGVPQEALDAAKRMADEAYAARLKELDMAPHDAAEFERHSQAVAAQVAHMRRVLREHRSRSAERVWLKGRPQGELDETRLVDGIAGSSAIYKHRGLKPSGAGPQRRRVSLRFVMDLSGSMYTFERLDGRKTRLLQLALFVMQSMDGMDDEYEYSMVGHSGSGAEAETLIRWGEPPLGAKERLKLLQKMAAHTQYCHPGDKTYQATSKAIEDVASRVADERFVFVVSDADLARYNLRPEDWNRILMSNTSVRAYAVLIGNQEAEAEKIVASLAPGHGYACTDTAQLAATFERIFESSVATA